MNRSAIPIISMMIAAMMMSAVVLSSGVSRNRTAAKPQSLIDAERRMCQAQSLLNQEIDKYEAQHGEGSWLIKHADMRGCYNLDLPVGQF